MKQQDMNLSPEAEILEFEGRKVSFNWETGFKKCRVFFSAVGDEEHPLSADYLVDRTGTVVHDGISYDLVIVFGEDEAVDLSRRIRPWVQVSADLHWM